MTVTLAIDAGTTGVRTFAVDDTGSPCASAYREFPQHFPRPGWVEHDPVDIWDATLATLSEVADDVGRDRVQAIGITNQRETGRLGPRPGQPFPDCETREALHYDETPSATGSSNRYPPEGAW